MTATAATCPVHPRSVPEGRIPLISIEGAPYDCGRQYADLVLSRYPGYRTNLDLVANWQNLPAAEKKLVEQQAPQLLDLYRGLYEVAGPGRAPVQPANPNAAPGRPGRSVSFALSGALTLDGHPMAGQTKDITADRIPLYIILRLKMTGAPAIMVLCYPGEVMGYGFWSPGLCLFRNTLYSRGKSTTGIQYTVMTSVLMSCRTVEAAVELMEKHGRMSMGTTTYTDVAGRSVSFETNCGGQGYVRDVDGLNVHTNHPLAETTRAAEHYVFDDLKPNSLFRRQRMHEALKAEHGRLTVQKVFHMLADHAGYPYGTCKHEGADGAITSVAVVVEPTRGLLHAVRGQPCCNWPFTYSLDGADCLGM